ncbi:MAG TPA: response regulator, partial [Chryseosolibacter sp.]|nr:response regulator [Chryseosolibacter sp.]
GEISVDSEPGKGTSFNFSIESQVGATAAVAGTTLDFDELRGKNILVVDDNATNLKILKAQLEQWNAIPMLARSGAQALRTLEKNTSYDLVITDMQMPEMDGIALAQNIRQRYPRIPLILLSSLGDERNKAHVGLFSSVLTKPVKHAMLVRHILNVFDLNKAAAPPKEEEKKLTVDFAAQYPLSILIAEDNIVNIKLAQRVLSKLGYGNDIAMNGVEALQAIANKNYDVVLMDVQMPEMDGLEATRAIRKMNGQQPVVIAMTANAMQGDKEICLDAGMNDYITKPLNLEDLIGIMRKWSDQLKSERKAS